MSAQSRPTGKDTTSLVNDFWGGFAAMLVSLPASIAFGVLIYTTLGPEYAGQGAMVGILGAAALGPVAALVGRTAGLISAPCAPSAAVLSALAAGLVAGHRGLRVQPEDVPALLALTALIAACFQLLYGTIRGGRLIKFIPYPVVSGYLSSVGILIALGQLPKLFGLKKDTPLIEGLTSPDLWKWQGLVVGIVTIIAVSLAPKITRKVPAAIVGLLGGVLAYFALGLFSPGLLQLDGNALIIGPIKASGSFFELVLGRATSLLNIKFASVQLIFISALTLSVLLSIDTLKTCVVLDALTRNRHNSNRELIGQGVGNLAAFLCGGMPGAGTMGPTLVNVTSGGRTFRSGIFQGVLAILALLLLSKLIAWVPIGALAGILLVVAWRMLDRSMFKLLQHPATRLDFAVVAGVVLVALTVDLIAASGAGVALAVVLFIRNQVRSTVIRRKRYLNQMSSKTRRTPTEREALDQHGDQGVFCELQDDLFFGTTDQLYTQLEPDLRTKRFILLDMRRVQSMDYTAAHLFEQMQRQLAERGGRLLFSGMPSAPVEQRDFEKYLAHLGLVKEGEGVLISETLDGALEWMEERILEAAGATRKDEEQLLKVKDFDLFREFDQTILDELAGCMSERSVAEGQRVFSQGDEGEELFLVRRGSVRILLPLEGGKVHHLATVGRGNFFGEVAFLDRGTRSAHVEAKVPTDLYVFSRTRFNAQAKADAAFGVRVFARLALAIAKRLRQTDAELRVLEER